ncbi:sulfotransferase domain-containing protein [Arenicella xantha]|uniref:Sulfotransferase domain-containing protein n=1 Tax=Arenicella xantha TaxID=644221 RepID=A0A395JUQ9_9GAMM|nr:sulfotransferase domain-containing protein [Arenicella xantha]RBP53288.1 sulfotransferase domain-containing protein [Arenicella xantha]
MTSVRDLIEDPGYFAYKFNFDTEAVEFVSIADGDLSNATWLNRDALDSNQAPLAVPLSQLLNALNDLGATIPKSKVHFIFHTAYCGSTFLSRCLDVKGFSQSLREPQLLLDAANAKRLQWQSASTKLDFRHLPSLAMRLLQKHALPDQTLIIKPINSVNNIIPELLQVNSRSKAVMLYTDARNFLLSTLKKGEDARQTVRAMFDLLRCDFPHLSQLRITDVIHMSDLKVTLTLWRLQLEQAEQMLKHFVPSNKMASLYAETLIADPAGALEAVNQFLELGLNGDVMQAIATDDVRFQDAKNSQHQFSKEKRDATYEAIESFYGADLENGYRWLTNNNPATSLTPTLTGGLNLVS